MASERTPRVLLLGKPGCHLCDEARVIVARVCDALGVGWAERSILDDPALAKRYAEEVPVTLVDGQQHAIWRVDEDRLRSALAGSIAQPT
jgi:hypothetical protein